ESKGTGHPDSICDAVCETCAKALEQFYKKRFNTILHYNIDKALLIAGTSTPKFKGGKITNPIKLMIAGRVTDKLGKTTLPIKKLIKDTATKYLKQFRQARFKVIVDVKSAAANLSVISSTKRPIANDTSFGCSHYPPSKTEQLVLDIRKHINSPAFHKRFPAAGPDTKIMAVRQKQKTELTIAIAFIGKHVKDMGSYISIKDKITEDLIKKFKVNVSINTLDNVTKDEDSIYLTTSGLSAEMGDDGQVGRGNRYNSLITPGRPMSIEALSGKNPRHPGRSYQIAAYNIAKDLVKAGAEEAEVELVTDIGAPLEEPKAVSLKTGKKISKTTAEKLIRKNIRKAIR
ncbi:methionine adenosyltransferase, partial [Nanoarchaeota archaeon]